MSYWDYTNCTTNIIWRNFCKSNFSEVYNRQVQNESRNGYRRRLFEDWLMGEGCYLKVVNGKPEICSFDEDGLVLFLLKWA